MASEILPILTLAALVAALAGSGAAYQGNPKGKRWRCVIPTATFVVVALGAAFVTGFLNGRDMMDVETGRMVMIGALLVVTVFCAFFFFRHR